MQVVRMRSASFDVLTRSQTEISATVQSALRVISVRRRIDAELLGSPCVRGLRRQNHNASGNISSERTRQSSASSFDAGQIRGSKCLISSAAARKQNAGSTALMYGQSPRLFTFSVLRIGISLS